MKRKHVLALVVGILLAAAVGVALAASFYGTTEGTTTWDSPTGPEITAVDVDINEDVPIRDGVVDFGHINFSSPGSTSAWARDVNETFLNVSNVDASANVLTIDPSDRQQLAIDGEAETVKWRNYAPDDGNVDIEVDPGASAVHIELTDLPTNHYLSLNDSNGNVVASEFLDESDSAWFTIESAGEYRIESVAAEDVFSDEYPADGETVTVQTDVDLNLTVDPPRGGTHSITFYDAEDDSVIGTDTVQDSGEAATVWNTPDLGTNSWSASINDSVYSAEYSFATPANVEIRNEQTLELIDENLEIAVQFFWNGTQVLEKSTSDGIVDLTGLPPDEMFVISATDDSNKFYDRRIILPSIEEQGTIYLLEESAEAVEVEFVLDDLTGEFGTPGTRLYIQRPFTEGGETEYRQLAGDRFGAANAFSQMLQEGVRYYLRVGNDGETRELGHYQADRDEVRELTIGELSWSLGDDIDDVSYRAERIQEDGQEYVRFQLNDTAMMTENLQVSVFETDNRTNRTIYENTLEGPHGQVVVTTPIPQSAENVTSWSVAFEADRGDGEISGTEIIGSGSYPVDVGGSSIMGLFSALLLVFVAGMFSVRVATLGIVIVPIVSLGLYAMGWLPLPLSWILAALALGVAAEFAARGGFSYR